MSGEYRSTARAMVAELRDRADTEVLGALYRAISVSVPAVRASLRAAGRPFLDPAGPGPVDEHRVAETADHFIEQARLSSGLFGLAAGMGGAASVPGQVTAELVLGVRLAQALAVVYGFDPSSDRGMVAVTRALAAGFEVPLPDMGVIELRVSDLGGLILRRPSAWRSSSTGIAGDLARQMLQRTLWRIGGRATRWVPVVGASVAMQAASERVREVGGRMKATLHRLADFQVVAVEDAVVVAPGG